MTNGPVEEQPLVSYLTLRRVIGALGVLMPVVLALWGCVLLGRPQLQASISDYYALRTRDVFVGCLFTIAWFLFAYKGPEKQDDRAGDLACLFALGVALFPTTGAAWERFLHFTSAMALFLVLATFSLALFTKSKGTMTPEKRIRNCVYRVCGWIMLACIALIGLFKWGLLGSALAALKPVFWLETLALWAFGVSWFIKGETLLKDKGV